MLLASNISLYSVHDFSYESTKNISYKIALRKIKEESRKGISLVNSLRLFPKLFPKIMIEMCSIGERTGNLALMFGHCAKIFEQDIDIFFKRFSALIEPTLMITMGLIVGSIALSIILPIYEITNHLTH
jgi:type II secretory pathway component PulF